MKRDEVFNEIYQALSNQLAISENNPYGSVIEPYVPTYEFDSLPMIVLSQLDYRLTDETLEKLEKKHEVVIEAQVYANTKSGVDKRVIANQLSDLVENTIQNTYGLGLEMSNVIPNVEENIYRVVLRFRGFVDDDTKVIYRFG